MPAAAAQQPHQRHRDAAAAPPLSMSPQELADRLNALARESKQLERWNRWNVETFARTAFGVRFRQEGGPGTAKMLTRMDLYTSGLWASLANSAALAHALRASEDEF